MPDPLIECRDLVRIYATEDVEVQALQGLALAVAGGELTAIVGASGSGKSTLLAILSGLDRPTAGSARIAGHDLATMGSTERVQYRRHTVGFVFQQTADNLLPYLTGADNIELPMRLAGTKGRAARVQELAGLLQIRHVLGRRPSGMSGGEQQRVAIAVALANAPKVLLADEPTGQLDTGMSEEVLESLRVANADTGVTVLVVTHDRTISEHVRRTVEIRDGRISTETVRADARGAGERFTVIDTAGRMQLPADFVERLDLRDRVRLGLEPDHVTVRPGQDAADD